MNMSEDPGMFGINSYVVWLPGKTEKELVVQVDNGGMTVFAYYPGIAYQEESVSAGAYGMANPGLGDWFYAINHSSGTASVGVSTVVGSTYRSEEDIMLLTVKILAWVMGPAALVFSARFLWKFYKAMLGAPTWDGS